MNPVLENLVTLQAIDLDLKRLREQLAEAPRRIAATEKTLKLAEGAAAATTDSLKKEDTLRRRQESDVSDFRGKILRLKRQLDTATSAQQVTAYERELAFCDESINKLEEEELLSMERTEALEGELASNKTVQQTADAALERARANSATLNERNKPAISALDAERSALRAELSASDESAATLANYDRIAKSRGSGVSEAVDHKCSACQMMLRPQRWNDLTGREHANDIYTCETCGRMLFWDPRRDTPGSWPPGERLTKALTSPAVA